MSTFLYEIQAVARDYLLTDEYFRNMLVIAEDSLDIGKDVENAMMNDVTGKTKGLCIVCQMLTGSVAAPNVPDIHYEPAQIAFDICENVTLNRAAGGTGKKGLIVAEQLLAVMANFRSLEPGFTNVHFYHDRDAIDRIDVPEWGLVVHRCRMNCAGGGSVDQTETVETPVWTVAGDQLSLTCATPRAAIYWAEDQRPFYGGYENAANVGALYELPFTWSGPHSFFARAYKAGMRASLLAIIEPGSFLISAGSGEHLTAPSGGGHLTP